MPIIEQEEMLLQAEAVFLGNSGLEAIQERREKLREQIEKRLPRSTLQTDQQVPQQDEEDGPKFKSFDEFELYAQTVFAGIGE